MGRWGDGKPLSCGGTRPLREVAQPVHAKRAAQGGMGRGGRGGDKGTRGQGGWGEGGTRRILTFNL